MYIYIIVLKKKWKIILSTNSVSCTILGDIQSVRMIHSTSYVANMVYKFLEMQWWKRHSLIEVTIALCGGIMITLFIEWRNESVRKGKSLSWCRGIGLALKPMLFVGGVAVSLMFAAGWQRLQRFLFWNVRTDTLKFNAILCLCWYVYFPFSQERESITSIRFSGSPANCRDGFPWEFVWVHAKSLQSCQTLCYPVDCSPPWSSVHGILQARILQWVGIFLLEEIFPTQGSNLHLLHLLHWHLGSLPLAPPGKPWVFTNIFIWH